MTRVNSEVASILHTADVRRRLMESGVIPTWSSPDAFAAYVRTETARWGKLIRANNIKAE
ncbi:MAG: hypothetical protein ACXWCW_29045 [Burkholderiales bacterium]